MKILLIIPRYNLTNLINYEYMFPLGLAYISSAIKKAGYEVDIINLNHLNGTVEEIVKKKLDSKKYDIVCSGHIGIGYAVIEKIINASKNHFSKPITIIGGALITSESQLMFESLKPDFGVIGEGEITIIELLNAIEKNKKLENINGIIFRNKQNQTIITNPRRLIDNIDSIPFPDFESFEFEKQLDNMSYHVSIYSIFDYPRIYPILCSRGCPFQCTFCYHSIGLKYRIRTLKNIMKELEYAIPKYKINIISIHDDLFSIDKKRLFDFCKQIKELFKKIPWECKWLCQISVQNVDEEMIKILKDSGCYAISYGFESYSQKVLKSMKKPITPEQIDRAIKLTMKYNIAIMGNFIFGDRAETKETAKETFDYWKNNCKGQIPLYFIQPYPDSEIYRHCIEKGIITDKLDFIKNRMNHLNWFNMTDSMTDKDILNLKKAITDFRRKYYNYAIPIKITTDASKNLKKRYNVTVRCPFCSTISTYKNCHINSLNFFNISVYCRNCFLGFIIVNRLYLFTVKYYNELDFLRKNFLFVRDNLLKNRM